MAFCVLLTATGFLGAGFGLVVPALNTFTAAFFPRRVDSAILTFNALLGVGTALALIFVDLGFWWGLPVLVGSLTLALALFAGRLPLKVDRSASADHAPAQTTSTVQPRFWIYTAFALVYGICETMNGNWASVYLSTELGASAAQAALALTVFWVSVTGGRVLFATVERWCPPAWTYRLLPLVLALAFVAVATTP